MKIEHFLTSYPKINLKWTKDLNLRLNTIKFLERNKGKLFDINHSNFFLDLPPRVMNKKKKVKKWNLVKIKAFSQQRKP